jgi:hypothetical protein
LELQHSALPSLRGIESNVGAAMGGYRPRRAGEGSMTTAKGRNAALKAWAKRRSLSAWEKGRTAEATSKAAFNLYFEKRGWRVAFFEGKTGSPRTGIIDAVAFRLGRKNSDVLDLRLVQLKGGKAGVNAAEIWRLKKAAAMATVTWLIAEFDGETETLHILPSEIAI